MLFFVTPPPRSSPRKERAGFWPEKKPKGILLAGRRTRGDRGAERGRSAWKPGKNPANDPLNQTKAFGGGSSTDGSCRRPERSETPRPLSLDTTLLGWRGFGLFKHRFSLLFLFAGTERSPVGTGGDGGFLVGGSALPGSASVFQALVSVLPWGGDAARLLFRRVVSFPADVLCKKTPRERSV